MREQARQAAGPRLPHLPPSPHVQRAVAAAKQNPKGGVVLLPAGTYVLMRPLTILRAGVVLRGAGVSLPASLPASQLTSLPACMSGALLRLLLCCCGCAASCCGAPRTPPTHPPFSRVEPCWSLCCAGGQHHYPDHAIAGNVYAGTWSVSGGEFPVRRHTCRLSLALGGRLLAQHAMQLPGQVQHSFMPPQLLPCRPLQTTSSRSGAPAGGSSRSRERAAACRGSGRAKCPPGFRASSPTCAPPIPIHSRARRTKPPPSTPLRACPLQGPHAADQPPALAAGPHHWRRGCGQPPRPGESPGSPAAGGAGRQPARQRQALGPCTQAACLTHPTPSARPPTPHPPPLTCCLLPLPTCRWIAPPRSPWGSGCASL